MDSIGFGIAKSIGYGIGKSIGYGIGKSLVSKKVSVSVSEIFGIGKKFLSRFLFRFLVSSPTGDDVKKTSADLCNYAKNYSRQQDLLTIIIIMSTVMMMVFEVVPKKGARPEHDSSMLCGRCASPTHQDILQHYAHYALFGILLKIHQEKETNAKGLYLKPTSYAHNSGHNLSVGFAILSPIRIMYQN